MVPRPRHPSRRVSARPTVHILSIIQRVKPESADVPLEPPFGVHQALHLAPHEHRPGISLPRPAKVAGEVPLDGNQVGGGGDLASLEDDPGVLVGVLTALRREDRGPLSRSGAAGVEVAPLQHRGRVAEDEVHRAVDVAVLVELAEGVGVERVLVAGEAAAVEG